VQRLALPLPSRPNPSRPSEAVPAAEPTLVSDPSTLVPAPTISREVLPVPSASPAAGPPDAAEAGQAAPGTPGAATSTTTPAVSSDQLEELAKALYDKIRARLKAELRLDRERWGRVTDLAR